MKALLPYILIISGLIVVVLTFLMFRNSGGPTESPSPSPVMVKASDCVTSDEKVCLAKTQCRAEYNGPGGVFSSCIVSPIDETELNKIVVECDKLQGTLSQERGRFVCNCTNTAGRSYACLTDLISTFENN